MRMYWQTKCQWWLVVFDGNKFCHLCIEWLEELPRRIGYRCHPDDRPNRMIQESPRFDLCCTPEED